MRTTIEPTLPILALCAAFPAVASAQSTTLERVAAYFLIGASVQVGMVESETDQAIAVAKETYRIATTDEEKYVAARLIAHAYATREQYLLAQIWLRLASQSAELPKQIDSIKEDYRHLNDLKPLSLDLSFGAQPSSNINIISPAGHSDALGRGLPIVISKDAEPISGFSYNFDADVSYRLNTTADSTSYLTFNLSGITYTLSNQSREKLTDSALHVQGSDYAQVDLTIGLIHRQPLIAGMHPTTFSIEAGKSYYGGIAYAEQSTIGASQPLFVDENNYFAINGTMQNQFINQGENLSVRNLSASWMHAFRAGDVASIFGSITDSTSENDVQEYIGLQAGLNFSPLQTLHGLDLDFTFEFEIGKFERSDLAIFTREDKTYSGYLDAAITQVEYFGFQPVITAAVRWTDSSLDLFDSNGYDVGFKIASSF